MTPIRRTDQREHLGDYNISCGASKELDDDQRYFYQQGFFSRLARALGGNQVVLIEPAGDLAPQDKPLCRLHNAKDVPHHLPPNKCHHHPWGHQGEKLVHPRP
jgi:hypothetical protein